MTRGTPSDRAGGGRGGASGFTLIELLVAMAILAILATLSFRGLGSILEAEARVGAETQRWNDLAVVLAQIERDLGMALPRASRAGGVAPSAAMAIEQVSADVPVQLVLTRGGDGADGESRRIGYRLRGNTLEYLVWPALDPAPGAVPAAQAILENVDDLRLRALGEGGAWSQSWPSGPAPLPRAVELRIAIAGGGQVTRTFALR